jgi:hypothetical protein
VCTLATSAHLVAERLGDLVVDERQEPLADVDDRDARPERREGARVLHAHDPRADDDERARRRGEVEHAVGVDDARAVDRHVRAARGRRPGGDDDDAGLDVARAVGGHDPQRGRVDELGAAVGDLHAVARELRLVDRDLARDDVAAARHHALGRGRPVADRLTLRAHGQLAERLARDRAGRQPRAAHARAGLDHEDRLAQLGALDRGVVPAGPGADDDQVVPAGHA